MSIMVFLSIFPPISIKIDKIDGVTTLLADPPD